MVLVFIGTLYQVHIGIYEAENRYFRSWFLFWTPPHTKLPIPWFPGGYIVGTLLLVNQIAAHLARFKLSRKKAGILFLHSGLILLLIGQLFADIFIDRESQMRLHQGQTKNYSESLYHDELAIIDPSGEESKPGRSSTLLNHRLQPSFQQMPIRRFNSSSNFRLR
jgi:hypothetical protein